MLRRLLCNFKVSNRKGNDSVIICAISLNAKLRYLIDMYSVKIPDGIMGILQYFKSKLLILSIPFNRFGYEELSSKRQ